MNTSKIKKRYYTYLLRCADDTIYCGYTVDLRERVLAHNKGIGAKYTQVRRPVRLVYSEEFETRSEAMKREAALKKMSRRQKLALIRASERREIHE